MLSRNRLFNLAIPMVAAGLGAVWLSLLARSKRSRLRRRSLNMAVGFFKVWVAMSTL